VVTEYKITKFDRYRDGGTTMIQCVDPAGNTHDFFSPQSLFPTAEKLVPTWDKNEIVEVLPAERVHIIELLQIEEYIVKKED
jgi:hypothetical protein